MKFQSYWPKTAGGVHETPTDYKGFRQKLTKLTKLKTLKKKNLRFMCKQYANLQTLTKSFVKFQNYWPKTAGGVALTRHLLTIRVLGKKLTKLTK